MTADAIAVRRDRALIERDVLETVEALTADLGLRPAARRVGLDDSLDRDLGLGSLERVELVLRLEEALGVRLPDRLLAEAESPRDLVRAVLAGEPALRESVPGPAVPVVPGTPTPGTARTLIDVLGWHAEVDRDRVHIFLRTDSGEEVPITYGELWDRSLALAAGLLERGARPGDSVALMLQTEEAFFPAFFGTLLAGAVPVPIYPPFRLDRLEEYARRQVGILENAEARLLVTFGGAERIASLLRPRVRTLREVVAVETLGGSPPQPKPPSPNDPALIQYTSGSTGEPKGVLLTHANLLANIRAMGEALEIRADDIGVSWLPLYHDMGLIGAWLGTLYYGIPIVILSPLAFLARPARWLSAIHAHRATFSAAPNFAFDLCVRRIRDEEIRGLDLHSWRLALNGSEPVSADTIERFAERFAPYGFRREAICPVYGLAESSVGLAMSAPGQGARVDRVAREAFTRSRRALPAAPDEGNVLRIVSCGRPIPGHEIRVVVGAGAEPTGDRVEGRVEFRGPSVTSGYFRNPEATRAVLSRSGWMDSGDLGYWADGDLFITGRRKDVIIKAGRNLYPQEVEEVVGEIPRIRKGCVAAFGVPDPRIGTERLVVVAESRETAPESRERLRALVTDRVVATLGIPPDTVLISPPGSILKTSSGKIRRGATREAFLRGDVSRPRPGLWTQRLHLLSAIVTARLGRLAARALDLAFGAWAGALLLATLPPLWGLVLLLPAGRSVDRSVRAWCRIVLTLAGCRPRVEGMERLPGRGAVVFAANHSSYVDSVALLAAIPADFRFVAKRELASWALVGTVIRKVAHPTIERVDLIRSVADAERVTAVLRSGTSLFFFPEGTFVRAPGILPFRLGAFKAAVDAGCPVIPVAIRGTRRILPGGARLPKPGRITIAIGEPVVPETGEWREMVRLRDVVRGEIARRVGEQLL